MKILGLGVPELIIILVIILVLFGAKNLPKLGSAVGKSVKNLREGMADGKDVEDASDEEEVEEVVVEEEPAKTEAPKKTVKKVVKKAAPKDEDSSDEE